MHSVISSGFQVKVEAKEESVSFLGLYFDLVEYNYYVCGLPFTPV